MKFQSGVQLTSVDSTFNIKPPTHLQTQVLAESASSIGNLTHPTSEANGSDSFRLPTRQFVGFFGGLATRPLEAELRNLSGVRHVGGLERLRADSVILRGRLVAIQLLR